QPHTSSLLHVRPATIHGASIPPPSQGRDWGLRAGPEVEGVCLGEFGRVPRIIQLIQLLPEGPGPEHGRSRRTGWLPEPEVVISIRSVHRSDLGLDVLHRGLNVGTRPRRSTMCPPTPYQQVAVFQREFVAMRESGPWQILL